MKLRIKGNSVRLRLSQSEVAEFAGSRKLEDCVEFGGEPGQRLTYALIAEAGAEKITGNFENGRIAIIIPRAIADEWVQTDQTGISAEQDLPAEKTLRISIEKDFACLTPRAGEDESDNYPHPKAGKIC